MRDCVYFDSFDDFEIRYGEITRRWLETRFTRDAAGLFVAHEPIEGLLSPVATEGGHLRRAARVFDALMLARRSGARSLLDVGGAEGYLAAIAAQACGMEALSADVSVEATARALETSGVAAVAVNASDLPFVDDSFDVVVMTEVLEHLVDPVSALLEARRVARLGVVFSTEECSPDEALRTHQLAGREMEGHGERNIFVPADFEDAFDGWIVHAEHQRDAADRDGVSLDAAGWHAWLRGKDGRESLGIIGVALAPGRSLAADDRHDDVARRIVDVMLAGVTGPQAGPGVFPSLRPDLSWLESRWRGDARRDPVTAHNGTAVLDTYCFSSPRPEVVPRATGQGVSAAAAGRLATLDERFRLRPERGRKEWGSADWGRPESGWLLLDLRPEDGGEGDLVRLSDDPELISPYVMAPLDDLRAVEVTIELPPGHEGDCAEFYVQCDGAMGFSAEWSALRPFTAEEGRRGLVFDLTEVCRGADYLVRFRIDPSVSYGLGPIRVPRVALTAKI